MKNEGKMECENSAPLGAISFKKKRLDNEKFQYKNQTQYA